MEKILLKEAKELQEELVEIRRTLHRHPETSFDIPHTLQLVEKELKEIGYEPARVGKAGIVATIGDGKGKTFLIRGDMDALPIVEDTELSFKSTNNNMHACGHDIHTTMMLGAAKLLKKHEASIQGTVKLMFQPAEETLLGAQDMIEHGVLENPKVDAGMMIHIAPSVPMDIGTVLVSAKGKTMSSNDWFEITISGKGGHGSMPHDTIDPMVPAAMIHFALNEIQARELAADELVAMTVGEFHSGKTSNVIPDTARMGGTIRTYTEESRQFIKKRMTEIVENIARAFRCSGKVDFPAGAPTFTNDGEVVTLAENILPAFLGQDKVVNLSSFNSSPTMGSEDFSYVSHEIPVVMLSVVAGDTRKGAVLPVHHPQLVLDEEAIPYGVTAYTAMALTWLENNK